MQPTGFGDALAADRLQLGSIPLTGAELFEDGRLHVARRCRVTVLPGTSGAARGDSAKRKGSATAAPAELRPI